jgi:hypothetical protein
MTVSFTVDEDVYRTSISLGLRNRGIDGREIRDIQHDGARSRRVHRAELVSRCFSSYRADHGVSARERFRRQRSPEAGAGTSDQKIPLSTHRDVPPPTS